MEYSQQMIADLLRGALSSQELQQLQRQEKDVDRAERVIRIEQERLGWTDSIVACIQEHLYLVRLPNGSLVTRCDCGQEFGDASTNWKLRALVYERDPSAADVFVEPRAADPGWSLLREFYCPRCAAQLDVEVVPRGYPFVFNALLEID